MDDRVALAEAIALVRKDVNEAMTRRVGALVQLNVGCPDAVTANQLLTADIDAESASIDAYSSLSAPRRSSLATG